MPATVDYNDQDRLRKVAYSHRVRWFKLQDSGIKGQVSPKEKMNRIDSLDWLRGILAFAIMLYHLSSWQLGSLESSSLLGRLGIYGVSMFFVLSGLSMAIVYHRYIDGLQSSFYFLIRRIFRIWPLLWVTVGCSVAAGLAVGRSPDWYAVAMNLTTAFGFVEPSLYISKGAWSIGNEMVYYMKSCCWP